MSDPTISARPSVSTDGYFGQLHSRGLLMAERIPATFNPKMDGFQLVGATPDGGDLMTIALCTVNEADKHNARRLVACWNACATVHTDALEDGFVEKTREDRNYLLGENTALQGQLRTERTQVDLLTLERDMLLDLLRRFVDNDDTPPPNCHCHLRPPCGDCVDNSEQRELIFAAQIALALNKPAPPPAAILAQAAEVGAHLDAESIEQGDPA